MATIPQIVAVVFFMTFLTAAGSFAQSGDPAPLFEDAIEDNSYFIEEAYNQEQGIVQHIFTAACSFSPSKDVFGTFTQEWPLWSQAHQLSYTIPYVSLNAGTISGPGDLLLNYRYQLTGHEEYVTIAPRISVILPVGDESAGLGMGAWGVQTNLPISKRISDLCVVHINAGVTFFPKARWQNPLGGGENRSLTSYNAGASAILLLAPSFNIMLETVVNVAGEFGPTGNVEHTTETIVSPGIRHAIDIGSLQIVPGLAVPLTTADGITNAGVFLYLSLEHPF